MESKAGAVFRICSDGWWVGWISGTLLLSLDLLIPTDDREGLNAGSMSSLGFRQAVLALKYIQPGYPFPTLYFGIANVIANSLIMLR